MALKLLQPAFDDLISMLNLDAERRTCLETAMNVDADESGKRWEKQMGDSFRTMTADQQNRMMQSGRSRMVYSNSSMNRPGEKSPWSDAVATVLSTEEYERWQAEINGRKVRQDRSFAQVLIAEVDKEVLFTAEQRARLEPLVPFRAGAKAATLGNRNMPVALGQNRLEHYVSRSSLMSTASSMYDTRVEEVLDSTQRRRWKEVANLHSEFPSEFESDSSAAGKPKTSVEDPDKMVSDFLVRQQNSLRDALQNVMTGQVEDIVRAAHLSGEAREWLLLASKGAVERTLTGQVRNQAESLRSMLQMGVPEGLRQRLEGMTGMAANTRDLKPQSEMIWQRTLEQVLNEEQRHAWQEEVKRRQEYMDHAVARVVLEVVDRRCLLTTTQYESAEKLVLKALREYSPDLQNSYAREWYLNNVYRLLPLLAIPDEDMKAILRPVQWAALQQEDLTNARSLWERVRKQHEARAQAPPPPDS